MSVLIEKVGLLIRWSSFLSLGGFAWLFVDLISPAVESRRESFFYVPYGDTLREAELSRNNEGNISMRLEDLGAGRFRHSMQMQSYVFETLGRMSSLALIVSNEDEQGRFLSAHLLLEQTASSQPREVFSAASGKLFRGRNEIVLRRNDKAPSDASPPQQVSIDLEIITENASPLILPVRFSDEAPLSDRLWIDGVSTGSNRKFASPFGWWQQTPDSGLRFTKAQLLSYTWGWGTSGERKVFFWFFAAVAAWILGLFALITQCRPEESLLSAILPAAGWSMLFLSVLSIHAMLTPPFHGPDEPDHFLTVTQLAGRVDLEESALALAQTGHLERIKRRPKERFAATDTLRSRGEIWPSYVAADAEGRSSVSRTIWSAYNYFFTTDNASLALLELRLINIVLVAACLFVGLSLAGLVIADGRLSTPFLALPLLAVPSFAFFSSVLSNYPYAIGGYLLQAAALGLLCSTAEFTRGKLAAIGALAGLGMAIAATSANTGIATWSFWALFLPGYFFVTGPRNLGQRQFSGPVYLIGPLMLMATLVFIATPLLDPGDGKPPPFVASLLNSVGGSFPQLPAAVWVYPLLALVLLWPICSLACFAGSKVAPIQFSLGARAVLVLSALLLVCVLVLGSKPSLPTIMFTSTPVALSSYVSETIYAFFHGLFVPRGDWLVVQSFWGWFGWLDTPMPAQLVDFLAVGTGVGLASFLLLSVLRGNPAAGAALCLGVVAGLAVCVGLLSAAAYMTNIDLCGRYLIAPYLFAAVLAAQGYSALISTISTSKTMGSAVITVLVLVAMAAQATSWTTILNRYFGPVVW